ncbi:AAA family ATPase [Novosphingobium sp. SG720]|uniref:AAA family ATPase n=1 Tax=Novosphingobium sp. SG720 TaxID=2586998 RepID=UPI001447D044|nr:AAA family ATPase [Novosphingobium sp. SG720]NKJ44625.1 hypothetical protein [Novosphingobium sp. SG720]
MKIQKFQAKGLNGYLDFDIDLFSSRNFLIGINGSGKTSVLKAIMGLITPDVDWLMNAKFQSISVFLEHEGSPVVINAKPDGDGKAISFLLNGIMVSHGIISTSEYRNMLRHSHETVYDEDGGIIRMRETSVDVFTGIDVIKEIRRLPTPLFLGLDRSNLPFGRTTLPRRARPSRTPHATLRAFLDESVGHAEHAVSQARIRANVQRQRRASHLRENMLLTLFSIPLGRQTTIPSKRDLVKYEKYRKNLKQAFRVLGLDEARVSETVDPFFSMLIGAASALSGRENLNDLYTGKDKELDSIFSTWMELGPRLPLLEDVEKLVNDFSSHERSIFSQTENYARIMNSFLSDSGKKLEFREDGEVVIRLPIGSEGVHVLSSGERQLFVLISTLMFGEDSNRSSVLIIDEPELSLHLKWQEMFVDAISESSPDTQLILATHSPSIILDQTQYCVDLV